MPSPTTPRLHLHSWLHHTVIAVALVGVASGFAQFAVTASLRDVATAFGADGASITEQVGLSTTTVGLGLAIIRLASLGALPLAGVADHLGRRRVMLGYTTIGLGLTALAALSPSFWWFVTIIVAGRPLLSAANAVGAVVASEETTSAHRTKAIALGIAGYGLGAGIVSVLRVPINSLLGFGFRGLFTSTLVLLAVMPLIARLLTEPDRFLRLRAGTAPSGAGARAGAHRPRGARVALSGAVAYVVTLVRDLVGVHPLLRRRLLILIALAFAFNLVTGPVNTFLFFYAEGELGISRASMAGAVVTSGPLGLVGLVVGRWAADRVGRRVGAIVPQLLLAVTGVLAYSGSAAALVGGYWAGVVVQGAYGTAFGALSTEVFPTSHRATAQGWLAAAGVVGAAAGLLLFGAVSDAMNSFVVAALAVCVPCAVAAMGFLLLPETRGQELEESAPEIV
jgi:AAHS family benzoate transporter-like MFS transporter